ASVAARGVYCSDEGFYLLALVLVERPEAFLAAQESGRERVAVDLEPDHQSDVVAHGSVEVRREDLEDPSVKRGDPVVQRRLGVLGHLAEPTCHDRRSMDRSGTWTQYCVAQTR